MARACPAAPAICTEMFSLVPTTSKAIGLRMLRSDDSSRMADSPLVRKSWGTRSVSSAISWGSSGRASGVGAAVADATGGPSFVGLRRCQTPGFRPSSKGARRVLSVARIGRKSGSSGTRCGQISPPRMRSSNASNPRRRSSGCTVACYKRGLRVSTFASSGERGSSCETVRSAPTCCNTTRCTASSNICRVSSE